MAVLFPEVVSPTSGTVDATLPTPQPTALELSDKRLKREQSTSFTDYAGSMLRQDGIIDGAMAALAGSQMTPQPGYFAGAAPDFENLKKDLWPEYQSELYKAVSPSHALYLKDRLLQKQTDLQRLGDLGMPGNVGRFALGLVAPDNLVWALTGGWVAKGVQMTRIAAAAREAGQLGKVIAQGEAVVAAGKAPAVAAGIAVGAADNAAFEYLRQRVNFEDSNADIATALLLGGAFTAPFAVVGARRANSMATAAQREVDTAKAIQKQQAGQPLTVSEARIVQQAVDMHAAIDDLQAGRIDEDTFNARADKALSLEDAARMATDDLTDKMQRESRSLIDEMYPAGNAPAKPRPPEAPKDPFEMPAAQSEIAAANAANPTLAGPASAFRKLLDQRKEEANRMATDAAARKEKEDVWAAIEQSRAQARKTEEEAMLVQRDLQSLDGFNPYFNPEKMGPEKPAQPAVDSPPPQPVVDAPPAVASAPVPAAPEAPAAAIAPAVPFKAGDSVSFMDKNGEVWDGPVVKVREDGFLVMEDAYTGTQKVIHHTKVDQHAPMSEAPEGFLPGSIGAAQISNIVNVATQRTAMAKIRFDYFSILNGSSSDAVKELAFRLMKDGIQVDNKIAQGWTASEHKRQLVRTIGGNFHREVNEALLDAYELAQVPFWGRSKFNQEFMALVARETRGDWTVKARNPVLCPAIVKGATAMREGYARALEEMKRSGVAGAENVPVNDLYVNRSWRFDRIRETVALHGEDQVVALLARAINVPGHIGDRIKAKKFLDTVRKLELSPAMQNIALQPRDMATLRNELAGTGKLAPDEIDDLVDLMFDARAAGAGDQGQMTHLKFRFDIDENAAVNLQSGVLRISDLFENDARVLMDTYLGTVGGNVGLAKVGIKSAEEWQQAIRAIRDEPGSMDDPKRAREIELLEDVYKNILSRPMNDSDFSKPARFAQALRGYTRSVTLGQLGITAAFEMHKAIGMFGFKAMMQSMPSFGNYISAIRKGYVPEAGLARDIMMMTGFGNEMASSYARALELEGGFAGGVLSRWEAFANKASHLTDVVSGNASFTSLTRQLSAMGATRQAFEVATGVKKLTKAEKRRWVGQGASDNPAVVNGQELDGTSDIDQMLGGLKDYAETDANGNLTGIRYDEWQTNDRGSYELYQLFISRQVRDAIQDQDIGETMPWMHTVIGKMIAELKTFMLVAHVKNFAKNLEYRDTTSLNLLMIGMLSESLSYSTQTAINFPNELEERLTAERISQAVATRMSMGGFSSVIAATGYAVLTGGDPLFDGGISKNTDSRVLFKTPSLMVLQKLAQAPQTLAGMVNPMATTTQREFQDLFTGLPGARLMGVPATIRYLSEGLPKSEPVEAP